MKPTAKVAFLDKYTEELNQLADHLLNLQDIADITVELESAERLVAALDNLKTVVENIPLS